MGRVFRKRFFFFAQWLGYCAKMVHRSGRPTLEILVQDAAHEPQVFASSEAAVRAAIDVMESHVFLQAPSPDAAVEAPGKVLRKRRRHLLLEAMGGGLSRAEVVSIGQELVCWNLPTDRWRTSPARRLTAVSRAASRPAIRFLANCRSVLMKTVFSLTLALLTFSAALGDTPVPDVAACTLSGADARAQADPASVFLAIGPGGHRMTSQDGLTWENHASWGKPGHDNNDLNVAVVFKGMAIVGGGYSQARLTATRDGRTWAEGALPRGGPIFGLEVVGEHLHVITLHGHVYKSADGEKYEWIGAANMPTKTHWIRNTVAGNGLIVGSGDYGPAMAFNSATKEITVTQMAGQKDKNAMWRRVAFGNGVFVVAGQDGLLASTKDGKTWQNNETHADRGDISSVVWTGTQFLASTSKSALASKDGSRWEKLDAKLPRMLHPAGGFLYGWSGPGIKLQRSRDGQKWEEVPNPKEWHVKSIAHGQLAGKGESPQLPGTKP